MTAEKRSMSPERKLLEGEGRESEGSYEEEEEER
jgi:hypothetical protein